MVIQGINRLEWRQTGRPSSLSLTRKQKGKQKCTHCNTSSNEMCMINTTIHTQQQRMEKRTIISRQPHMPPLQHQASLITVYLLCCYLSTIVKHTGESSRSSTSMNKNVPAYTMVSGLFLLYPPAMLDSFRAVMPGGSSASNILSGKNMPISTTAPGISPSHSPRRISTGPDNGSRLWPGPEYIHKHYIRAAFSEHDTRLAATRQVALEVKRVKGSHDCHAARTDRCPGNTPYWVLRFLSFPMSFSSSQ